MRKLGWSAFAAVPLSVMTACGDDGDSSEFGNKGGSANGGSGNTGGLLLVDGGGGTTSGGAGGGGGTLPLGPNGVPIGFTKTDTGAWKLGPRLTGTPDASAPTSDCGSVILALVRDFKDAKQNGGHPDFEHDFPDGSPGHKDMVQKTLGVDRKPVYAPAGGTIDTTSPQNFREWYVNGSVNQTFSIQFFLEKQPDGKYTFDSNAFFPLDGSGFGNQGHPHNFHFTTEVHTEFLYKGGETFRFQGDDDLWVFINRKLVIDLGGIHGALPAEIQLDTIANSIGITKNKVYPIELFHAERHTVESHFRIDTTLAFVNCGTIIDDPAD